MSVPEGALLTADRLPLLLARLQGRLDHAAILVSGAVSAGYAADAAGAGAMPLAVLRPRDTAGVSAALAAANDLGQPIVVQGGRTGLSGAARPQPGEVVLSLERMAGIESLDPAAQTLIAAAGTPLQRVQEAAAAANLYFGVDIGARGTATVGGNVATNAGGIRVLRYGMYRAQVAGVEAVLADGTVLSSLKGLAKDNSGYDLAPLFVGTEGTLGVITRACLKLHPMPRVERAAFVALPSLAAAQALLARLRDDLSGLLSAFEAIFPEVYAGTLAHLGLCPPVKAGAGMYAMIEIQGQSPEADAARFETALADALEAGLASDIVLSNSAREFDAFWAIRDGVSDFIYASGVTVGFDISVPLARMQDFLDRAARDVAAIDSAARHLVFGHLGDGNLHYCLVTREPGRIAEAIFAGIAAVGGGVSAEHGIGTDKRGYLHFARSPAEIAAMRRLKAAFDPNHILNRGRVFAPAAAPLTREPA